MSKYELRTRGEAMDSLPCCQDHTSIEGLAPLMRRFPKTWHEIIESQSWGDVDTTTTLREYLREGGGGLLIPTSARDTSVKKKRCGARRVADLLGDLVIGDLSEEDLLEARRHYEAERGRGASSGLVSADMRVLRQAVYRAQTTLGSLRVKQSWGGPRPASGNKAKSRLTPTPPEVRQLLDASDAVLCMAIALIVGCGLLPGELLALRVKDVNISENTIHVHHRGVRGWGQVRARRIVRVPGWAWQLVLRAHPRLARMPKDALLFGSPRDSGKPWTSLGRAIRRAAVRAGLQARGARDTRWTPIGLRLLYQEVARKLKLPRALVRGTVVAGMAHRSSLVDPDLWLRQSDRLAQTWTWLLRPPGYHEGERHHVPRRSPSKVRPGEPEWPNRRTKRWLEERERKRPLPSGCDDVPGVQRRRRPERAGSAGTKASALPTETRVVAECMEAAAKATRAARDEDAKVEAARADGLGAGLIAGATAGVFLGLNLAGKKEDEGEK